MDSLTEKTIGELNPQQKDELIHSLSFGFKKISIGTMILLILIGIAVITLGITAGVIIGDYVIKNINLR